MTTQTEAERLADCLETHHRLASPNEEAAAELRRLVSFNQQLMDEVARLNKAVADEREACAKACEKHKIDGQLIHSNAVVGCAAAIRARSNT